MPSPPPAKPRGVPVFSDTLQTLAGPLEVKFKGGAFATWSDGFVRLEGRWLAVYKRERDSVRQGAIEIGPGVQVTDIANPEAAAKFPRRFDLLCRGGLLPHTEVSFRTKSRKDRDLWVVAIANNLQLLASSRGQDPRFGVRDLEPVVARMRHSLTLHPIRIRSDLSVRCATGEAMVAFLVADGVCSDRVTAAGLCRQLVAMNAVHHVVWEKDFADSPDPYVLVDVSNADSDYQVEHFLKYLDARKFWKYLEGPDGPARDALSSSSTSRSNGSARSNRSTRGGLASSAGSGSDRDTTLSNGPAQPAAAQPVEDLARFSTLSVSTSGLNVGDRPQTQTADAKKAKKCGVCTKSFNPLRRRHSCCQCLAVICSNCSVVRTGRAAGSVDPADASARMCISCKLSATASFVSEADADSSTSASARPDPQTPGMGNSLRRKSSHTSTPASAPGHCTFCSDALCGPLSAAARIPYPVVPPSAASAYIEALPLDNEAARLQSVDALLSTMAATPSASRILQQFCHMAAIATGCPYAMVGLLDRDAFVVGAQVGLARSDADAAVRTVARPQSLAAHACRNGAPLACADLTRDVRFRTSPWLREALPDAAFYLGIPLTLENGHTVGTLEVLDCNARFQCGQVVSQLQAVVRGLLKLFEDIIAAAQAQPKEQQQPEPKQESSAMETQLLQLLSQTTSTQEQLRSQQGQMVHALSSHSQQISELAKQLERMESALAAKLGGGVEEVPV
ncbi:hypothetical protein BBJ28_00016963 [Nothophytophthora sp. Chile5]|nr:hypothetical protein BBJ28_00016963 [Nothophytophthora sp. Chile5]